MRDSERGVHRLSRCGGGMGSMRGGLNCRPARHSSFFSPSYPVAEPGMAVGAKALESVVAMSWLVLFLVVVSAFWAVLDWLMFR